MVGEYGWSDRRPRQRCRYLLDSLGGINVMAGGRVCMSIERMCNFRYSQRFEHACVGGIQKQVRWKTLSHPTVDWTLERLVFVDERRGSRPAYRYRLRMKGSSQEMFRKGGLCHRPLAPCSRSNSLSSSSLWALQRLSVLILGISPLHLFVTAAGSTTRSVPTGASQMQR